MSSDKVVPGGLTLSERVKLDRLLSEKIPKHAKGTRPKAHKAAPDPTILSAMMSDSIDPIEAAKQHGFGSSGGSDHSSLKAFRAFLTKHGSNKALKYIQEFTDTKDHFKHDRELSHFLGLNFQKGARKPNIDIPAGAADPDALKAIGLGLSGKTDNWEAKSNLQDLKYKGVQQMLYHHKNETGGLQDIIDDFSNTSTDKEVAEIDITNKFKGALAIPGTYGANKKLTVENQLSTYKRAASKQMFDARWPGEQAKAQQNKKIKATILAEEYDLENAFDGLGVASQGLIPNFSKGGLPELKYIDLFRPTHHHMNKDGSTVGLFLPFNFDMHQWGSQVSNNANTIAPRMSQRQPKRPDNETKAKLNAFLDKANKKVYHKLPGGKSFFGPKGDRLHRSFRTKEGIAAHYAQSFDSAMKETEIEPSLLAKYLPQSYYYKHRMPEQIFKVLSGRFDGPYAIVDESKIGMNNRMLGSWTTEGPSNRKTFDVEGLMENYNFIDTMGGALEAEKPGITQALRANTLMKGPSGMTDGIDLDSARGLIPNFVRGLLDFDRMHKAPEVIKNEKTGEWEKTG